MKSGLWRDFYIQHSTPTTLEVNFRDKLSPCVNAHARTPMLIISSWPHHSLPLLTHPLHHMTAQTHLLMLFLKASLSMLQIWTWPKSYLCFRAPSDEICRLQGDSHYQSFQNLSSQHWPCPCITRTLMNKEYTLAPNSIQCVHVECAAKALGAWNSGWRKRWKTILFASRTENLRSLCHLQRFEIKWHNGILTPTCQHSWCEAIKLLWSKGHN